MIVGFIFGMELYFIYVPGLVFALISGKFHHLIEHEAQNKMAVMCVTSRAKAQPQIGGPLNYSQTTHTLSGHHVHQSGTRQNSPTRTRFLRQFTNVV